MEIENNWLFLLIVGIATLAAVLLPLIKSIKADYASIFVMILFEYIIAIYALFSDFDRSIFILLLVGWGFVIVTAAIIIVGADIRDALRAQTSALAKQNASAPKSPA